MNQNQLKQNALLLCIMAILSDKRVLHYSNKAIMKAKQYIEGYEDLSWFEILDEQGKKEVDNFRLWASK
ncbi:hypothetical protein P7H20_09935 [Paenibacillus larvae]|nr:hypothetical protein [Paenibacillus larvae]MDT2275083.1 hypothetical protein [Paenibacillus larvae]